MSSLRRVRALALAAACLLTAAAAQAEPRTTPVTVFAASSLTNALEDMGAAIEAAGGVRPRLSFASSSTLAKQIEAGAGADIFISADEAWMDYLEKRALVAKGTRRMLAANRLVLIVPADAAQTIEILADGKWITALPPGRIATGDPAHVPAGRYAREALETLGAWASAEPRLARADNVRNALLLVERGEAVAGIVYATDALVSKAVRVAAMFPATSHRPIAYPVAMMTGRIDEASQAVFDFLSSDAARRILLRHGFSVPPP